jgi:hypothetical protein
VTLVLSCLTPGYVVQATDRRLTDPRSGAVVDDYTNKAVFFCGRMAYAYTGLSRIAGKPTDLWLTQVLSRARDLNEATEAVAGKATRAFQARYVPGSHPPHAFVSVGWARHPPDFDRFRPFITGISNFQDDKGERQPRVLDGFSLWIRVMRDEERAVLVSTGQQLPAADERALERTIGRVVSRGAFASEAVRLLGTKIREVARVNPKVGPGLLINAIPRSSVKEGQIAVELVNAGAPEDVPTFLYSPPGDDTGTQYGPMFTCGETGATSPSSPSSPSSRAIGLRARTGPSRLEVEWSARAAPAPGCKPVARCDHAATPASGRARRYQGVRSWCDSWFHVELIGADLSAPHLSCHAAPGLRWWGSGDLITRRSRVRIPPPLLRLFE